jgi:hypothetical protein
VKLWLEDEKEEKKNSIISFIIISKIDEYEKEPIKDYTFSNNHNNTNSRISVGTDSATHCSYQQFLFT